MGLRRVARGVSIAFSVGIKGVVVTLNEREDRSTRFTLGVSASILSAGKKLVEHDRSSFRRFVGRLSISSAACFARAAASYWA
jgi:hypothetical protein